MEKFKVIDEFYSHALDGSSCDGCAKFFADLAEKYPNSYVHWQIRDDKAVIFQIRVAE